MPRRSAASLSVVAPAAAPGRLDPPRHMPEEAATVWRSIVASEGASHFQRAGMRILLEAFCMAAARARWIDRQLAAANDLNDALALGRAADAVAGRLASLAIKLRITPAARERVTDDDNGRTGYDAL